MTSPTGAKNKPLGFTLIELSLVVLIISIIVVIATPRFRATYETIKFRSSVYNLVKLMNYARERAVIERKQFRIHFFEDEMAFCLETTVKNDEDKKNNNPEFEAVHGSLGKKIFFPKGIEFDIDEPREDFVLFYPNGQADECVIYVTGKKDMVYTITTKKMVGLIRLFREKKRL